MLLHSVTCVTAGMTCIQCPSQQPLWLCCPTLSYGSCKSAFSEIPFRQWNKLSSDLFRAEHTKLSALQSSWITVFTLVLEAGCCCSWWWCCDCGSSQYRSQVETQSVCMIQIAMIGTRYRSCITPEKPVSNSAGHALQSKLL